MATTSIMPRFDIIMPTIGRPSVFEAIESINNQEYDNWFLWVICDGLKELTWPYTDGRFKTPKYGRVIGSELYAHNDSGTWARNEGIELGNAEWIVYCDCDDVWTPEHLSTIVSLIAANPAANMIRTAGREFRFRHKSPRSRRLVRKLGAINTVDVLTPCIAHTRELFMKTTGWKIGTAHDRDLWNEMLANGGVAAVSDIVTVEFER